MKLAILKYCPAALIFQNTCLGLISLYVKQGCIREGCIPVHIKSMDYRFKAENIGARPVNLPGPGDRRTRRS